MRKNILFFFNRLFEQLWFKPLIFCIISIAGALIAHLADDTFLVDIVPDITRSSLEELLTTISASMLVIAIFAVGSMISAFAAASGTATPRSFKLIVADDVSQNALSVYIGSFIFSIVAIVAFKNEYYGKAGNFTLFVLTLAIFALVIITFLRWVERISKLGQLGHTIKKVEEAAAKSISNIVNNPFMGGVPVKNGIDKGEAVFTEQVGYVQFINIDNLQTIASDLDCVITLNCLPGTFTFPGKPLVFMRFKSNKKEEVDYDKINKAFIIGESRVFDHDPRFGFIALSEIGSRALSPGINDPGTAISIITSYVRLFSLWCEALKNENTKKIKYDRVEVPEINIHDLFEDAFRPISRDGAGTIEVMIRMQKALTSIAYMGTNEVKKAALYHSLQAYERAETGLEYKKDLELLKEICMFTKI